MINTAIRIQKCKDNYEINTIVNNENNLKIDLSG